MPAVIHIVDDDGAVRAATSYALASHGYSTQIYASGTEFLRHARLGRGCVLLDLCMDGEDGLDVLNALARRGSRLPVIAMSGHDNVAAAVAALKLGAIDFIQKPYEASDLVVAVERALEINVRSAQREEIKRAAGLKLRALSERERHILRGLLAGMTNKEIARRLDLSPRTVEMHRANMMRDLEIKSLSEAIRLAIDAELAPLEAGGKGAAPTAAALAPAGAPRPAKRPAAAREDGGGQVLPPVLDVLEGTTDGVFLLDRDFNFTFLNRNALDTIGKDRDLVGRNVWTAFPGAARTLAFDRLRETAEDRKPTRFDFFEPDLGRWFDVSARPIPTGLQVFFRDFSTEREAFAAVKQSEERLRLALEASGDGAWDWDIPTGRIAMSRRFLAYLGYGEDELPANVATARSLIHPADRSEVERKLAAHFAGETEAFACEYRVRRRDGEWRWSFDRGRVVARDPVTGAPQRMVGTATDISRLKAMEEEAREAAERIALAQEGAGAGTWDLDLETRKVRLCPRTRVMHGLPADTPDEIDESEWAATIHPDDLVRTMAGLNHATETGLTYTVKYRTIRPGGEHRWLLGLGKAVPRGDGPSRRFVGIAVDETERERGTQELKRLQAELTNVARLSAMGAMVSTLAHELNQPLTALANYVHGLRRTIGPDPVGGSVAEALDAVERSAALASRIVRQFQDPERWTRLDRRPESLSAITAEAGEIALIGVEGRGIELDVLIPDSVDRVRVDRVQIQQVLINLVRNAIDAMAENGGRRIVISAAPCSEGEVQLRVADEGGGIAEAVRERLFAPFVTSKPRGTGIGLSICRTIVEAHGGRIWAETRDEGGAIVAFTLPSD